MCTMILLCPSQNVSWMGAVKSLSESFLQMLSYNRLTVLTSHLENKDESSITSDSPHAVIPWLFSSTGEDGLSIKPRV